jgi:hypothetical protein
MSINKFTKFLNVKENKREKEFNKTYKIINFNDRHLLRAYVDFCRPLLINFIKYVGYTVFTVKPPIDISISIEKSKRIQILSYKQLNTTFEITDENINNINICENLKLHSSDLERYQQIKEVICIFDIIRCHPYSANAFGYLESLCMDIPIEFYYKYITLNYIKFLKGKYCQFTCYCCEKEYLGTNCKGIGIDDFHVNDICRKCYTIFKKSNINNDVILSDYYIKCIPFIIKIQQWWSDKYWNPKSKICQSRLTREYDELFNE